MNPFKLKPKTQSERLPNINENKREEVYFQRNKNGTHDERFTSYFHQKYHNSRTILHDFQKTLSNLSFLGLKLSDKPAYSLKLPVENTEIFLDNYIGQKHNKKPASSQSSRSRTSQSKFRGRNILPISKES